MEHFQYINPKPEDVEDPYLLRMFLLSEFMAEDLAAIVIVSVITPSGHQYMVKSRPSNFGELSQAIESVETIHVMAAKTLSDVMSISYEKMEMALKELSEWIGRWGPECQRYFKWRKEYTELKLREKHGQSEGGKAGELDNG